MYLLRTERRQLGAPFAGPSEAGLAATRERSSSKATADSIGATGCGHHLPDPVTVTATVTINAARTDTSASHTAASLSVGIKAES